MKVNNQHYRTIWLKEDNPKIVQVIDQNALPYEFKITELSTLHDVIKAINDMTIRGAGLIGATAGYGMYLAALTLADESKKNYVHGSKINLEQEFNNNFNNYIEQAAMMLKATRPTAINLANAVDKQLEAIVKSNRDYTIEEKVIIALQTAESIANNDAESCKMIGKYGLEIIKSIAEQKRGNTVNILTHCNAGWLAFVDYGSALSPIYAAFDTGIDIHVYVDETRPRNQGYLTAWELGQHGIKHTIIPDNSGALLMQKGMIDLVITGADRVTSTGYVANKIGTYLKAIAAKYHNIPFYVAFPTSTFDLNLKNGLEIPIEERSADEIHYVKGVYNSGSFENIVTIRITPKDSPALNHGFDITPPELITGFITEKGNLEIK